MKDSNKRAHEKLIKTFWHTEFFVSQSMKYAWIHSETLCHMTPSFYCMFTYIFVLLIVLFYVCLSFFVIKDQSLPFYISYTGIFSIPVTSIAI